MIGVIFTLAYLSGAVFTAVWGYLSDRVGRRKILMLLAILTILSNIILIYFSSLFFILFAVIVANVGAGGSGGGPFNPVEEALLAEKCRPENRNKSSLLTLALGRSWVRWALWPAACRSSFKKPGVGAPSTPTSPLFALTIVFSCALLFVYGAISEQHQPRTTERKMSKCTGVFVTKMSLLAIVDNFGAGMAGSLVAYWFFLRFGANRSV